MDTIIHTLDARGNIMLEVMRDYFKLSPKQMHAEIINQKKVLDHYLLKKGIDYNNLKNALTPDKKKKEIALFFDTLQIESDWYGYESFNKLIPLLKKESSHSILAGDYIGSNFTQTTLQKSLLKKLTIRHDTEYKHSSQYYIIYINNLSDEMFNQLDAELINYTPYIGFADMSYNSTLKTILSTMLVNCCIKYENKIIQGHEPDRDNLENINIYGYPFESYGYNCLSISSDLFNLFLSYKIERPVIDGFKDDTHFALNTIHLDIHELDSMDIQVEDAKLGYIQSNKAGSLEVAGLSNLTAQELANEIKTRINSSYIYSMSYNATYNVAKFNIMLEFNNNNKAVKLLAAMEYMPHDKKMRLITFF